MDIPKEITDIKFQLRGVEAYLKTILETQALILKALQRDDVSEEGRISKEQWMEKLKQVQQDHQNNPGAW